MVIELVLALAVMMMVMGVAVIYACTYEYMIDTPLRYCA